MEFYINELSLHGQYSNAHDAVAALTTYNQLLSLLRDTQTAAFYHPDFLFHFDRKTLQTEAFQITLDRNPRIGAGFRALVARKLQAKDWRETRVHTDDTFYYHQKELVTDTTLAEVAARNAQNGEIPRLLLNFAASKFSDTPVLTVVKNEKTDLLVRCADDKQTVENWLKDWLTPLPTKRRDAFLSDNPSRFRRTTFVQKGATVYTELETAYFWYLDTLHRTHFEVFNAQKEHIGEADLITGALDTQKKDPNKNRKLSF